MYFWYYLHFFHFDLEKFISFLGQNTSKYCSGIIVVHVHATVFFSKVRPVCHNIANGIKLGSDSINTDKHASNSSKPVCWGVK